MVRTQSMIHLRIFSLLLFMCCFGTAKSQSTFSVTDPEAAFKEARIHFVKKEYGLAYPIFNELHAQLPQLPVYLQEETDYYYLASRLRLRIPAAVAEANAFLSKSRHAGRSQLMNFHLAHYYYEADDFSNGIRHFEAAGLTHLNNEELADAKFEKAYCLFNLKRFNEAKPLFNEVHQLPGHKYYIPANYYYGFISYVQHDYTAALTCFRLIEGRDDYRGVVPYYIAEIYYFQQKRDEALRYTESVLQRGGIYYEKELRLLSGQIYFEKKNFQKALPGIEFYVKQSDKVSREVMYELSYCYYEAGKLPEAIEGLKQLSNERDSLGQNSMYLLADCYIRTNQKANARAAFQFCASNNSNREQQEISRFHYAKLSYDLGYQDIALNEMQAFVAKYPQSKYLPEAREVLVSLLANTNNYKDALTLYNSFEKPTPSMQRVYPRILFGHAVSLLNDQQYSDAEKLLDQILKLPASSVTSYTQFWKGEIAFRSGRWDEAIRMFQLFVQSGATPLGESNQQHARYTLGYCWLKKENYKQALTQFEPIAKSAVTASLMEQDAFVRVADCYFMNREYNKATSMYNTVISQALSQSDYAMFQLALIAGVKSGTAKIAQLEKLERQYPQSNLLPEGWMEIADAYMVDEKFDPAISYLNKITGWTQSDGLKPKAELKLGLAYYNTDRNAQALVHYQQLLKNYPQSPEAAEALQNVKSIYVEEGRPAEYVELMKANGIQVSVSEADSLRYTAAELKYTANDCTSAIKGFNDYLQAYPDGAYNLQAHFYRADCFYKQQQWEAAYQDYAAISSRGLNRYFEKSTLLAARLAYLEKKDYAAARELFSALKASAVNQENQLEAIRGLVRCEYQLKNFSQANQTASELLSRKGVSTDDKAIAYLVLGKSLQEQNNHTAAISAFKSCASLNKTAWGAEARYEIAASQFTLKNFTAAEKAAQSVIRETSGYDFWVVKAYLLIGDVFLQQRDYFNAKATYQSVAENASDATLKEMASQKLQGAIDEERKSSKVQ